VVRVAERLLLRKLLVEQLVDDGHVDVEQRHQRAEVGDVLHQDPLARVVEDLVAELGEGDADEGDVGAGEGSVERPARIVQQRATRADLLDVARVGLDVHGDDQVVVERARRVAGLADPHLVPGRQPLDVGGKQVLSRDGDPHPEDRLHEETVRARRPRPVDVSQLEREVVGPDRLLLMHAITPVFGR
jgi:hypothetical protein